MSVGPHSGGVSADAALGGLTEALSTTAVNHCATVLLGEPDTEDDYRAGLSLDLW